MRCFHYEQAARFLASPGDCLWKKQHTVFLIITTAPNKPKVGVSKGIQNKHCAPQRRPTYFKKQSKKKTSWRQPAEHEGTRPCLLIPVDSWHQGWGVLLYSVTVVLKGSMCQCYFQDLGATFILSSEGSFQNDKSPHFNSVMNLYFYLKWTSAVAAKTKNGITTPRSSRLIFFFFSTSLDDWAVKMASSHWLQTHQLKNEWWICDALTWTVVVA